MAPAILSPPHLRHNHLAAIADLRRDLRASYRQADLERQERREITAAVVPIAL